MRLHAFGEHYLLQGKDCKIFLTSKQKMIIDAYFETKDVDLCIKSLIGDKPYTPNECKTIRNHLEYYFSRISDICEKKLPIDEKLIITGVFGAYYPRVLNIELCNFCNFSCGHCYKNATNGQKIFLELSLIKDICQKFKRKVQVVHLTGGEPLAHPAINKIIESLYSAGFLINITTNGSLFKRLMPTNISKVNNWQISLYGFDLNSYMNTTGSNSFRKVNDFIRYLESNSRSFTIGFLINKLFLYQHDAFNNYMNQIRCDDIIFSFASPAGRCIDGSNRFWLLNNHEKELARQYLTTNKYFRDEKYNVQEDGYECDAGSLSYSINEYGMVKLCHILCNHPFQIGSIDDLINICKHCPLDIAEITSKWSKYISPLCRYYPHNREGDDYVYKKILPHQ